MAPKWLAAIGNFFKSIFGFTIKSDPFKELVASLMPVAIAVVMDLNSVAALSNEERRARALVMLRESATTRGLEFLDHMLNLLIEIAVAKVKGTIG